MHYLRSLVVAMGALQAVWAQNDTTYPSGQPLGIDVRRALVPVDSLRTVSYRDPRTGSSQTLTYYVSDSGNAIYQDDVNWGSEEQLLNWSRGNITQRPPSKRGIGVKPPFAWPQATITYRYNSCATRQRLSGIVNSAIEIWKKGAPYLQFRELAPAPYTGTANGVLTITQHDANSYWCYSTVALANGGTGMRMNLQWLNQDGSNSCGQNLQTVLHEFGHAIGLMHEQTRPDRNSNINFDCTKYAPWTIQNCNAGPYACCTAAQRASQPCCGDYHNYDFADTNLYSMYGPYDCKSIMHYSRGGPLQNGPNCIIQPSSTPSQGDYDAVCQIYQPFCNPWKALNFCTLPTVPPPACGTCNPISGLNKCDITTSCISTGTKFHCACRAGFKAAGSGTDVTKNFRLPWDNYRHLVFVPENTPCDTLCNNHAGFSPDLCSEVKTQDMCIL